MKAVLCTSYGPPDSLVLEDTPDPAMGEDEVLVAIHAAAVNFPDVLMIENKYQFRPPLPFSPGGEISGTVMAAGPKVKQYKQGDRVIGSCGWGGFAEKIALKEGQLLPVPAGMDFPAAAAGMMAYGTSYYALKDRAQLKKGENLLVLGAAGGVGLAAVELGVMMGANVIAAVSSNAKGELTRARGAAEVIVYPEQAMDKAAQKEFSDKIKAATGGQGADVVYDPAGGAYAEPALRATAWNGRFLVIGFAAGEIPKIPLNLALLKSASIVGVFWGAFRAREPEEGRAQLVQLGKWFADGTLTPHISRTFSLAEAPQALKMMAAREALGKIVILPQNGSGD